MANESFEWFDLEDADSGDAGLDWLVESVGFLGDQDKKAIRKIFAGARCLIVEHHYIDKDYRNVYSGYYSKKFSDYSGRAIRIHIFDVIVLRNVFYLSSDEFNNELGRLSKEFAVKECADTSPGYRGNVVLRPTEYSRLGRCLLDPRKLALASPGAHQVQGVLAPYRAYIMGQKLEVMAFPHQSQDAEAHVCAETAMWSLFRYLSQRYPNYREIYPFDVALLNKDKSLGRTVPSRGLVMTQIAAMFAEYGLEAEYFDLQFAKDQPCPPSDLWCGIQKLPDPQPNQDMIDMLVRYLQIYVDSGLPPIIGLPGHAVVAFGYVCDSKLLVDRGGLMIPSTDFLRGFVVNDDNCLPYQILLRDKIEGQLYKHTFQGIDAFVAPLPAKVFLSALNAEMLTNRMMASFFEESDVAGSGVRYVRRMFCTSSKNYKQLRSRDQDRFSRFLISQPLSHFLWVTEFVPLDMWGDREMKPVVSMEIVLDATAGFYDQSPFLWMRSQQRFWYNPSRMHGWSENRIKMIKSEVGETKWPLLLTQFRDNKRLI
ncbi:MAG: hypothetical protein HQL95_03285 [Magnetococcales bacterium]|nr:hypothetical protein [Magnetococcales bacterium]